MGQMFEECVAARGPSESLNSIFPRLIFNLVLTHHRLLPRRNETFHQTMKIRPNLDRKIHRPCLESSSKKDQSRGSTPNPQHPCHRYADGDILQGPDRGDQSRKTSWMQFAVEGAPFARFNIYGVQPSPAQLRPPYYTAIAHQPSRAN